MKKSKVNKQNSSKIHYRKKRINIPHYNHSNMKNLPCPRCPKICHSISELTTHLRTVHRYSESEIQQLRGRGFFEEKIPTAEGDIAVIHQRNAMLAQMKKEPPLNVPMNPPPAQKKQANLPAGWQKTIEGYSYEKVVSQEHTIDSIIKKVLKGSVISNHAIIALYTYKKEVGTLLELEKIERLLEAKLDNLVTSDPEYYITAKALWETKEKIRAIKQDVGADPETKPLLEDWYSGDPDTDEHIEWQENFMQKALIEAEQAQIIASKNSISNIKTAKFIKPITRIISKMIGLEEPALVTKAALNSFENLIDVYDKTKNIDDALISGVKSFVINYTKGEVENYVENVALITNKSDREYEAAIKGSVLMAPLYAILENIEDNL